MMVQQKSQSETGLIYNSAMQNHNVGYSAGYNKTNCSFQASQSFVSKNLDQPSAATNQVVPSRPATGDAGKQGLSHGPLSMSSLESRASSAGLVTSASMSGSEGDHRASSADSTIPVSRPGDLMLTQFALGEHMLKETSTPTPTQFFFPKKVTEEQEDFTEGFTKALAEIYKKEGVMPSLPGVLEGELNVKQEINDCANSEKTNSIPSQQVSMYPSNNGVKHPACCVGEGHQSFTKSYSSNQMMSVGNNQSQFPVRPLMQPNNHGMPHGMGPQPGMYAKPGPSQYSHSFHGAERGMDYFNRPSCAAVGPPAAAHSGNYSNYESNQMRYPTHVQAHSMGPMWSGEQSGMQWMKQEPLSSPPMRTYSPVISKLPVKSEQSESSRKISAPLSNAGSPMMSSASTSSGSMALDLEEQERLKLERKRAKNRIAAQRCQMRKIEKINRLEDKVSKLHEQNANLAQTVSALNEHIAELRRQISAHANRGCRLMLPTMSAPTGAMK